MAETSGLVTRPGDPVVEPPDIVADRSGAADDSATLPEARPNPERAYERLAEDEALRRGLDDATFGPLLDLAASLAVARADRFASTDALHASLRQLLVGAAEYARSGKTVELAAGFAVVLSDAEANEVWLSLPNADSPEARSTSLVRAAARATGLETAVG